MPLATHAHAHKPDARRTTPAAAAACGPAAASTTRLARRGCCCVNQAACCVRGAAGPARQSGRLGRSARLQAMAARRGATPALLIAADAEPARREGELRSCTVGPARTARVLPGQPLLCIPTPQHVDSAHPLHCSPAQFASQPAPADQDRPPHTQVRQPKLATPLRARHTCPGGVARLQRRPLLHPSPGGWRRRLQPPPPAAEHAPPCPTPPAAPPDSATRNLTACTAAAAASSSWSHGRGGSGAAAPGSSSRSVKRSSSSSGRRSHGGVCGTGQGPLPQVRQDCAGGAPLRLRLLPHGCAVGAALPLRPGATRLVFSRV